MLAGGYEVVNRRLDLGREGDLQGAQVVPKLGHRALADQGGRHQPVGSDPCEGQLRGRAADLRRELADLLGQRKVGFAVLGLHQADVAPRGPRVRRRLLPGLILARQDAPGQRAVAAHADPQRLTRRQQLHLGIAVSEIVQGLDRRQPVPAMQFLQAHRPHDLPGAEVRDTHVEHFARADEVVQGCQRLFQRRAAVIGVQVVDVYIVGAQALQAGLDGLADVLAGGAGGVRAGAVHCQPDLRRQHNLLPPPGQGLPHDSLRGPGAVLVGGVQEVDAGVQGGLDDRQRFLLRRHIAEHHAAQAELGDLQARSSEVARFHGG